MRGKIILLIPIFIVLLVSFWSFINRPSVGKINYKPEKLQSPTPTPMELIRVDGENLSFAYENKYELREAAKTGNQMDNWELVGKQGVMEHIVITVSKINSKDLADVSGVTFRRIKPEEYSEEKINAMGIEGAVFKNKENFEKSAFFIKDGKAITVSMTSTSADKEALEKEFGKLVLSLSM